MKLSKEIGLRIYTREYFSDLLLETQGPKMLHEYSVPI